MGPSDPWYLASLYTSQEAAAFQELPWERANSIEPGAAPFVYIGDDAFLNRSLKGPLPDLRGVLPFCENEAEPLELSQQPLAYRLDTKLLASFFLLKIPLMRTYLEVQRNLGKKILPRWNQIPDIKGFSSGHATPESANAALNEAAALPGSLLLECAVEGISVFHQLKSEPPTAVNLSENKTDAIQEIIAQRLVQARWQDKPVSILNVQFASPEKLDATAWASLFWNLSQKYKNIIVHTGHKADSFWPQQFSTWVLVRPKNLWQAPEALTQMTLPGTTYNERHVHIIEEMTPTAFFLWLRTLESQTSAEMTEWLLTHCVFRGMSGLWALLLFPVLQKGMAPSEFLNEPQTRHIHKIFQNFHKWLKPEIPRSGYFARGRFQRQLTRVLPKPLPPIRIALEVQNRPRWVSAPILKDHLAYAITPRGLIAGNSAKIGSRASASFKSELAFAFARGLTHIEYVYQNKESVSLNSIPPLWNFAEPSADFEECLRMPAVSRKKILPNNQGNKESTDVS